jgi:hypothetical protein
MRIGPIILALVFVACSSNNNVPSGIISPDKMQLIVFDLSKADEFVNNFIIKDTALDRNKEAMKLYQQVFIIHKVTREEFYKSFQYYQSNPDKNKLLFDSIVSRQTRLSEIDTAIK